MRNSTVVSLTSADSQEDVVTLTDVLSFRVVKEYYTPYTTFVAEIVYPRDLGHLFKKVEFILNGYTIHSGFLDSVIYTKRPNFNTITIQSKSFTSMLCQNQLEPGIKSSVSLNSLVDSFITIPEVIHEDNSNVVNYIYVKPTSSLWDAVINLTHKLNGGHPYICENNKVMVSNKENPRVFDITKDIAISSGRGLDTTKMVSDIHMQDINGTYNTYNINNEHTEWFNISRHKQIDLDRQYLSNPQDALVHKVKFSMRGYNYGFASYHGYRGEDICDIVNIYEYFSNSKISKIEVTGSNGDVITKVYAYIDDYISY